MSQYSTRKGTFLTILSALTAVMLLYLALAGAAGTGGLAESVAESLTVRFLKVGKADAIILECGGEIMVIDAGEDDDGQEVVDTLRAMGAEKVDILIITHFDKDHVGGADTLVRSLEVGRVILPDYGSGEEEYLDFIAALQEMGIAPERLTGTLSLALGCAGALVEAPEKYAEAAEGEETDNDHSLITTVTHGSMRLVFTGDIEKTRIKEWLFSGGAADCDLLKVPHHGEWDSALDDLLEALTPEYAVICDSDKNPADSRTLSLLTSLGTEILETRNGDVTVISTGSSLEVRQ